MTKHFIDISEFDESDLRNIFDFAKENSLIELVPRDSIHPNCASSYWSIAFVAEVISLQLLFFYYHLGIQFLTNQTHLNIP